MQEEIVLAYHDRSDGGLLTTVAEMMFAGRCGVDITLDDLVHVEADILDVLFNEELGAVFQIRKSDEARFVKCFAGCEPSSGLVKTIGHVRSTATQSLTIRYKDQTIVDLERAKSQKWWSSTSYEMQKLRDNPACAESEFESLLDDQDPGLHYKLKYSPADSISAIASLQSVTSRPKGMHPTFYSVPHLPQ